MESGQDEELVSELKTQLQEEGHLSPDQRIHLLNTGLHKALTNAALQMDRCAVTRVKSHLYLSGVLRHCVLILNQHPRMHQGNWSAAATLAQLTSSCCVGLEPGSESEAFDRLFLPSVMDGLLSLASRLMRRTECASLFRKVMDSVGYLLRHHTQLTTQVLSSVHYEKIQMCDDVAVSLLCVHMWIHTCTANCDFLSLLTDDSALLLLNEAVGQLAVSSDAEVGAASIRLILLLANQQQSRVLPLLQQSFRGLDSLLDKDWRGQGFDEDLDQLIGLLLLSPSQVSTELVRAACVIQAAWRSFQTRRRVKKLGRVVSTLQRRYRARRKQQQQQTEARQLEEELKYQVCVRRQQARREFHQKQRKQLQLLPPDQVQAYLQECERRAAVVIQSVWRGFRERRHQDNHTLRHTRTLQQAARTLQRAVRRFLYTRRAARAPPTTGLWIGQQGLTDSRRADLKGQVEEYIRLHPSSRVSLQECVCLHEEVQLLLLSELQRGDQRRKEEEKIAALLAHTHTQLELLREAPTLSVVTVMDPDHFLSPSGPVAARARDAHNALLQTGRLPWWRTLEDTAGDVTAFSPAHLQELEAELGGLFVGGGVKLLD